MGISQCDDRVMEHLVGDNQFYVTLNQWFNNVVNHELHAMM
jgi:hypothetical protein